MQNEANMCKCGHGQARHADRPSMKQHGFTCQISTCPCWDFEKAAESYVWEGDNRLALRVGVFNGMRA